MFIRFGRLLNDHIGILEIITVSQTLGRCSRDPSGGRKIITVAERSWRCGRVCDGAGESQTLPRGPGRRFRVWNGAGEPAAIFYGYNTVTKPVILPKSRRHRFKPCNFRKLPACLTRGSKLGALSVSVVNVLYFTFYIRNSTFSCRLAFTGCWRNAFDYKGYANDPLMYEVWTAAGQRRYRRGCIYICFIYTCRGTADKNRADRCSARGTGAVY